MNKKKHSEKNNTKKIKRNEIISIITVVKNDVFNIERTIISVLNQTYKNKEHIIFDGGSNDGTIDIIKKYEKSIDNWKSSNDDGIYDAMNKAIGEVNGEWIIFMNSGDCFHDDTVIEKIFAENKLAGEIIYGDCIIYYKNGFTRYKKAGFPENMWKGMIFSHQSVFVKKILMLDNGYNIENKIAADFELFYKLYKNGYIFNKVTFPISVISADGISDRKRIPTIQKYWKVVNSIKINIRYNIYYIIKIMYAIISSVSRKVIPGRILNSIIKLKYSVLKNEK